MPSVRATRVFCASDCFFFFCRKMFVVRTTMEVYIPGTSEEDAKLQCERFMSQQWYKAFTCRISQDAAVTDKYPPCSPGFPCGSCSADYSADAEDNHDP